MTTEKLLGFGIFMWDGFERRENRYGRVWLDAKTFSESTTVVPTFDREAARSLLDKRVHVRVKVIEARQSGHAGDAYLKIMPTKPKKGSIHDLGVGKLGMAVNYKGDPQLELIPNDNREQLWMDPRVLYQLHDQTVEVYAEETELPFSPMPTGLRLIGDDTFEGTSNGDGSLQVKGRGPGLTIPPVIERMGGGMFVISSQTANGNKGAPIKINKLKR